MGPKKHVCQLKTRLTGPALLRQSKRGICLSGEDGVAVGHERTVDCNGRGKRGNVGEDMRLGSAWAEWPGEEESPESGNGEGHEKDFLKQEYLNWLLKVV